MTMTMIMMTTRKLLLSRCCHSLHAEASQLLCLTNHIIMSITAHVTTLAQGIDPSSMTNLRIIRSQDIVNVVGLPVSLNFTNHIVGVVTHSAIINNRWVVTVQLSDIDATRAYCRMCGGAMQLTTEADVTMSTDASTGQRVFTKHITSLAFAKRSLHPGASMITLDNCTTSAL